MTETNKMLEECANYLLNHCFVLGGVEDALVFAFGQYDAFDVFFGLGEHRTHEHIGFVDLFVQFVDVGIHVADRAGGHAGIHGGLGNGGGDAGNQARIEGLGNQVFGAEF